LTLAACARVHAACDPLYAFETYQQQLDAYVQCARTMQITGGEIPCQRPAAVPRPEAEHGQCDRLGALCKGQRPWGRGAMADEYQIFRDLLTNGIGGAGTGAAIVYLWLRYGRTTPSGNTGLTAAEARSFIEEQRERLRNWFDEARMRIRDLEQTMDKI